MKKFKKVYVLKSLVQEEFIIFETMKKAEDTKRNFDKVIFNKSKEEDLYITDRIVF